MVNKSSVIQVCICCKSIARVYTVSTTNKINYSRYTCKRLPFIGTLWKLQRPCKFEWIVYLLSKYSSSVQVNKAMVQMKNENIQNMSYTSGLPLYHIITLSIIMYGAVTCYIFYIHYKLPYQNETAQFYSIYDLKQRRLAWR